MYSSPVLGSSAGRTLAVAIAVPVSYLIERLAIRRLYGTSITML